GWARELWFESVGLPAQFPPVEEEKNITTRIGAARAEKSRSQEIARGTTKRSTRRGATKGKASTRKTTGRAKKVRNATGRRGKTNPKTKAGARRNKVRAPTRGRNG
ncbi:MAG TPA: hypothetical protein VGB18_06440, partial [Candidatus Thermoplasmatota archaeon]